MTLGRLATASRAIRSSLGIVIAAILLATLMPSAGPKSPDALWCVACGEGGIADFILNVILFMPLGLVLCLAGVRFRTVLVACCLLSAGIELAQEFIPGRDTSLGDVIANTTGSVVGFAVVYGAGALVRRPRAAAVVALSLSLMIAATIALTGYLVAPEYPPTIYYGQWTAEFGNMDAYRGHVLRATLSTMPIPSWRLDDQAGVHALLRSGVALDVVALAGPRTHGVAPILSIGDDQGQGILILGARGPDLILQYRTRARAWGLDQPYLTVRDAFTNVAVGDTMRLAVWHHENAFCVVRDALRACPLGFTAGAGWSILIYPKGFPDWLRALLGAAWVAGLFLLVGCAAPSWRTLALGAATGLVALAVMPGLVGLMPTPLLEWLGAPIGLAVGLGARWLLTAHEARVARSGLLR